MKRTTANTAGNTTRHMLEWLLLVALAMLLCFASCKKDAKTSDTDTTVKVETEVETDGAEGEGSDSGVGEPVEGETAAEGETPADDVAAADGDTAEGEGAAEDGAEGDADADGAGDGGDAGAAEGSEGIGDGADGSEGTAPVEASIDPEKVYIDNGCTMCHKVDRSGGTLGPDIRNIAEYWNPDSLTAYLKNPSQNISKHPRLVEMEKEGKYLAEMPPLREQDESRIKALVDWLLTPAE